MDLSIDKTILWKRLLAVIIDSFVLGILQFLTILLMVIINRNVITFKVLLFANIIATSFNFCLYILKDMIKGQSVGKKVMKIAVRESKNHKQIPNIACLAIRNLFILIWPIELFVLILNKDGRRLGDRIANTEVVLINK